MAKKKDEKKAKKDKKEKKAAKATAEMLGYPWVSSNLVGNLDPSYKPGPEEDFYVYVNRDWLLKGEIEEGEMNSRPMMEVAEHMVEDRCCELLAGELSDDVEIRSVQNYYQLMRDWEGRDKAGVAELDETLKRIDAISSIAELNDLFCDPDPLRRMNIAGPTTMLDFLDGNKHAVYVLSNLYSLQEDAGEYRNPTPTGQIMLKKEHDIFIYVASKTCIADRAEAIYDACLAFETEMSALFPSTDEIDAPGKRQELARNRVTKEELIKSFGAFPIERVLDVRGYGDVDLYIELLPEADAYFGARYDEEHLEAIKAFLMTSLVRSGAQFLTKEIYEGCKHIDCDAMGKSYVNDERTQCRKAYQKVFKELPSPVSKLYVSHYADDEMRTEIRGMCDRIVEVYKKMLAEEDWLTESTRSYAIEKLEAMKFRVLYADVWEDYSGLDIRSAAEGETLWSAHLKVDAFKEVLAHSKIGTMVDSDIMPNCIETNCNYNPYNNSVNIYLGFLSELTYESDMPLEEKMGALGMVIGHEISHGFDTLGMLQDKHGVSRNWWTDEDIAAYHARTKKATDWYDTVYKPLDKHEEGIAQRELGETIADLGSLSVSMTLAREVEGFDYDKFFRANARLWRRMDNRFCFEYMNQIDPHPMDMLRVNLTLAQCEEFHKTYGVKEGDRMYFAPEDRMRLW